MIALAKTMWAIKEVSGTSILKKWHGSLKFHRLNKMDIIPQETMDG